MSADMVAALVRQILPFVGALCVTLGLIKADQANELVNQALVATGAISTLASLLWAMKANTKSSILQSATAMPEVSSIEVNDTKLATSVRNGAKPADESKVNG